MTKKPATNLPNNAPAYILYDGSDETWQLTSMAEVEKVISENEHFDFNCVVYKPCFVAKKSFHLVPVGDK